MDCLTSAGVLERSYATFLVWLIIDCC